VVNGGGTGRAESDDRGREKVIDYVMKKYRRENVCQIITFGTM
jgi:DNA polymerase-3 subunit alpha